MRACIDADLAVEMVPGPSAALAALVLSGLPTSRFRFEGFLPRKGAGRTERIAEIADADSTVVLYESPHRVAATLRDLLAALGPERPVAVARELTKLFEDVVRGPLGTVVERVDAGSEARGEHVIVVAPAARSDHVDDDVLTGAVRAAMTGGASARDAATAVARDLGVPRRRAYDVALQLRATARR